MTTWSQPFRLNVVAGIEAECIEVIIKNVSPTNPVAGSTVTIGSIETIHITHYTDGTCVRIAGPAWNDVQILWDSPTGPILAGSVMGSLMTGADGVARNVTFQIPYNATPGAHSIYAKIGQWCIGSLSLCQACTNLVGGCADNYLIYG